MISKKELEFVSSWASRIPHPGYDYAKATFEKLFYAKKLYDEKYKDIKYSICFSNKNEIELEIMSKNLAHMLGIDYKDLSSDYNKEFRNNVLGIGDYERVPSYELLTRVIENADLVMEYEKEIGKCLLNYYQIGIKCAIFDKVTDLSKFNYGCIEFDKEKYNQLPNRKFTGRSEKILYTSSGEINVPYFMMGIIPDGNQRFSYDEQENLIPFYVVETIFAPIEPGYFFESQEVSIPTHLLYDDNNNHLIKKEATNEEKLNLLRTYKKICLEYNVTDRLNISGDYELILTDLCKKGEVLTLK